ncbi:hypothetical protein LMG33818_002228 [Halomonadaceae bacterium LMG 33818]|uniref:EAL domain-containing protein n=1 Tax=Cernens ardua TaxID=3402176 RepID=UPI003EDCAC70
MPLTAVVNYFNEHLDDFNRSAESRHQARYLYDSAKGEVSGEINGLTVHSRQSALYNSELTTPVAYESHLDIRDNQGKSLKRKALYYSAWASEEVIFLDRFLRILHTLHYLAQHTEVPVEELAPIIMDVHWWHVRAVETSHGQVFEQLLTQLGIKPSQIILRMQAQSLIEDEHVRAAVRSFEQRGYRLLVEGLPVDHVHWSLLAEMGVSWVAADPDFLQAMLRNRLLQARLDQWIQSAHGEKLKVWLQALEGPKALELAWRLGADAVSGSRLDEIVSA